MKKQILTIAGLALFFGAIILTGCKKDDTTAPVITLTGSETVSTTLNATFTDPGATATDDQDGDLTSSITVTSTVNKDLKGTYKITYTVSDAAGNTATKDRTVNVVNSLDNMGGSYSVSGVYDGSPDTQYTTETMTASSTTNNRILFGRLCDYSSAVVYANISGNSITIPTQDVVCGSDNLSRQFIGTGSITDGSHFVISGTVALTSNPTVTVNWNYNFTKI